MRGKGFGIAIVLSLGVASAAPAAVTPLAYYQFGDKAGDTNGTQATVGSQAWSTNGSIAVVTGGGPGVPAGNTKYAATPGAAGYFGINTTTLPMPADNWGVELFVRTSSTTQSQDILVQNGSPANGNLKISQAGANWAASYHNLSWVGGTGGTGQPVAANQWTELAVVRSGGVSTFYINKVPQASTSADTPVWGTAAHLSVNSGGATGWDGDIDELRYFSFSAGAFSPSTDLVPEPGSLAAFGTASLLALRRRRREGR